MSKINCTAPDCKKCLPPEAMWLPERRAREAANGGTRVELANIAQFAVCGHHGHLLRKTGIKVYRFADEVKREEDFVARREAEGRAFSSFAERFAVKAKPQGNGGGQARPRFDGVGQGLSRCAKLDAAKRQVAPAAPAAEPQAAE